LSSSPPPAPAFLSTPSLHDALPIFRGKILMIGGLKEKLLAAARAGIKRVLIPKENAKDLEEIPDVIKDSLEIVPVSTIDEVFERSEEHTSELQSRFDLVCRLLLEKK